MIRSPRLDKVWRKSGKIGCLRKVVIVGTKRLNFGADSQLQNLE